MRLEDHEFQTFMSEEGPGIILQDETIENPACFWTDHDHVYLRTNWSMWSTVSLSSPDQVMAICKARYCRIVVLNGKDCIAPVYHIGALPEELALQSDGDGNEPEPQDNPSPERKTENRSDEYTESLRTIVRIVNTVSDDLEVFKGVRIENDTASLIIANDSQAVLLDIAPENRDFFFTPPLGEERHRVLNDWPTEEISLDFVDKLRAMKDSLQKEEPKSIVDIGFLGNTETIETLQFILDIEEISDLKLFTYADLCKQIDDLFYGHDPET